jgi:penicillin-binding protein 1B
VAVRVQVPRKQASLVRLFLNPFGKFLLLAVTGLSIMFVVAFTFFYVRYARQIDEKLKGGPFPVTSMIFASPRSVSLGDEMQLGEVAEQLRRSGYGESRNNRLGWYHVRADGIEIFPGPDSFFEQEAGVIKMTGDRVSQIISLRDNTERTQYLLEPELITNLSDRNREKRRLVHFPDFPKVLVNAVISAEDKRFFLHSGFDPLRIMKTAYDDVTKRRRYGASTLSMQLARMSGMFGLGQEKTLRRKAAEVLITLHLEQKLSKEEIFEYYANQVDLGRRGSFAIRGFGEASQAYFGKDLSRITVAEAATLAGLIQRPSFTNPIRWPERAKTRRNVVLGLMRENEFISEKEYAEAITSPLTIAPGGMESTDAPYFVDLVNDSLQEQFQNVDFQSHSYRVYTTLDMNLQRAAAEAVRTGIQEADEALKRRRKYVHKSIPDPQVALVALDAETGEVKALVGGRNYGLSQLDRVLAKRQPGSVFKPFVYAAAMNTALYSSSKVLTPASSVVDEPTTFWFDGKPYEPSNFQKEYYGVVTLRKALSKSLNVPTVKVAEMVGYGSVVELARQAGMNLHIRPTPAVALGAYDVTPMEIAGAYTIFAHQGVHVRPSWIKVVRNDSGTPIYTSKPESQAVLDPRVAYLMESLLEEVLRSGTGAGVRSRGFGLPAAGKTGTSRDGWFAGFTSKLICVVWVGFDDGSELGLEGAHSALPIWTEFMKRAHQYREYRNVRSFAPPAGIVSVEVDPTSGELATPACPTVHTEVFIAGSQPVELCHLHGGGKGGASQVAGWETPAQGQEAGTTATSETAATGQAPTHARKSVRPTPPQHDAAPPPQPEKPREKKSILRRLMDVFK